MLMRYIGPLEEVQVSVAGYDFGVVKNGEALVVPDELAETVAWSEHWEDVKATKKNLKNAKEPVTDLPNLTGVNEPGTADEGISDSNTINPDENENVATDNGNEEGN